MNTQISIDSSLVVVTFQGNEPFRFNVDDSINLNDFIEYLSNLNELVSLSPEDFDSFEVTAQDFNSEALKLVEYLYEILNAFNESYEEVFLEDAEADAEELDFL
jgi:hypothetical protein